MNGGKKEMRKKYRKIFENLEEKLDAYYSEVHRLRLEFGVLEQMVIAVKQHDKHYIKKTDYDDDKIWWTKRLDEMESKLSMKFYQNVGIYKKIRHEFSSQIAKNMNDIKKLESKDV